MTKANRVTDEFAEPRRNRGRFRLWTLLGLVALSAAGFVAFARYRESRCVWERNGGMIGWDRATIEARLGPPSEIIEGDAPDEHQQKIRLRAPGVSIPKTHVYKNFDGHFIVWFRQGKGGELDCFGSKWAEKRRYY